MPIDVRPQAHAREVCPTALIRSSDSCAFAAMNALRIAAVAAVTLGIAAAPAGAAGPEVVLKNISFTPQRLTVKPGTIVTWSWQDGVTGHNVTSQGKLRFKSSPTQQKGTWKVRFTKPGTYKYLCTLHPGMVGSIVVR
jgi:plastocyanin